MSGALSAGEALHDRIAAVARHVKPAVLSWGEAASALLDADDLVERLKATARLTLAAEALERAAGAVKDQARAALAEVMADTGCASIEIEGFLVTQKDPARRVLVTDRAAIPPDLMVAQDPKPDMDEIKRRLKQGALPYAAWSNGGAPTVAFTKR